MKYLERGVEVEETSTDVQVKWDAQSNQPLEIPTVLFVSTSGYIERFNPSPENYNGHVQIYYTMNINSYYFGAELVATSG